MLFHAFWFYSGWPESRPFAPFGLHAGDVNAGIQLEHINSDPPSKYRQRQKEHLPLQHFTMARSSRVPPNALKSGKRADTVAANKKELVSVLPDNGTDVEPAVPVAIEPETVGDPPSPVDVEPADHSAGPVVDAPATQAPAPHHPAEPVVDAPAAQLPADDVKPAFKGKSYKYKARSIKPLAKPDRQANSQNKQMLQIMVTATKSGETILLPQMANGNPPYTWFTEQKITNDPYFMVQKLGIDQIHSLVAPEDPNAHKSFVCSNGRERGWMVLVKICEEDEENTHTNRRTFAENFVYFFNHPDNRKLYKYPMEAYFAGDLTPQNPADASPMSHWLTIRDTMEVCQQAIRPDEMDIIARENGSQPNVYTIPTSSVVRRRECLEEYYMPEHIPLVYQEFGQANAHVPAGEFAAAEQEIEFAGLPDFRRHG